MDDAQRVDLGVALFIPYRYMEDRIFRAIQQAGFDDWTLARLGSLNASPRTVRVSRTSLIRRK